MLTGIGGQNDGYIRTDIAQECREGDGDIPGVDFHEEKRGELTVTTLVVRDGEGERAIGKPVGEYVTVEFGKPWLASDECIDSARGEIASQIKRMAQALSPGAECVLVVGLGNRHITSDAIGPEAVSMITVTRHIRASDPGLFDRLCRFDVAAMTPGVLGETGIETVEMIIPAVGTVKPQLVIAVDALAARSPDRLATTVQITNNGICPGSGVGNSRKAVSKETLGVPVIAVGIPTVVDSPTLVTDALRKAGVEELSDALREVLNNGKSFFVTLKEADVAVRELSTLVSAAIDEALTK